MLDKSIKTTGDRAYPGGFAIDEKSGFIYQSPFLSISDAARLSGYEVITGSLGEYGPLQLYASKEIIAIFMSTVLHKGHAKIILFAACASVLLSREALIS